MWWPKRNHSPSLGSDGTLLPHLFAKSKWNQWQNTLTSYFNGTELYILAIPSAIVEVIYNILSYNKVCWNSGPKLEITRSNRTERKCRNNSLHDAYLDHVIATGRERESRCKMQRKERGRYWAGNFIHTLSLRYKKTEAKNGRKNKKKRSSDVAANKTITIT